MMKFKAPAKTIENEDGLSLVEMVVAMMVFAIIALSAYPLFFRSVQLVSLNNLTTAAVVSTNDIIEQIRNTPTCANLETLAANTGIYEDSRGIEYRITLTLPDDCEEAESVPFEFVAERVSDSKILLQHRAEVLVPPRGGLFELGG